MEWEKFKESPKEYPENIVEDSISGFPKSTDGLAQLAIRPKNDLSKLASKLTSKFQFDLDLYSKYLNDYIFTVLEMGYDIEIFPVKILVEPTILAEINKTRELKYYTHITAKKEEDLQKALELVFKTARFAEIVAGLMKVARKRKR